MVQVKNNRVMRVVPLENEEVNECWIADRDRFSYEALNSEDRLMQPMLKQNGEWITVDWSTALEYVANGVQQIRADHGDAALGCLASPHSTLEELYLATQFMRGLGSDNIDTRLRAADFTHEGKVRWLGTSLASLSTLDTVLIVGSHIRKDQPLLAQRVRQAARRGAKVFALNEKAFDWAMPVAHTVIADPSVWVQSLADIAAALAQLKNTQPPVAGNAHAPGVQTIAAALVSGERKAILLGNAAAHHAKASGLLALAQFIGQQAGCIVGYLGEAANTVGAQLVSARPLGQGKHAAHMLQSTSIKAMFLLHTEPQHDCAVKQHRLDTADMVVTLSPFKTNLDISDVLLPVSPFTETAGTFVNTEGRAQSFHGVVKPLGETRPAWKVFRVLGSMLGLAGFAFETIEQVRAQALPADIASRLSNETHASIDLTPATQAPVCASIYQLDALVRRAPALQMTADARVEVDHG
jgi:NADH-quinone oxidoreductase subunit G